MLIRQAAALTDTISLQAWGISEFIRCSNPPALTINLLLFSKFILFILNISTRMWIKWVYQVFQTPSPDYKPVNLFVYFYKIFLQECGLSELIKCSIPLALTTNYLFFYTILVYCYWFFLQDCGVNNSLTEFPKLYFQIAHFKEFEKANRPRRFFTFSF